MADQSITRAGNNSAHWGDPQTIGWCGYGVEVSTAKKHTPAEFVSLFRETYAESIKRYKERFRARERREGIEYARDYYGLHSPTLKVLERRKRQRLIDEAVDEAMRTETPEEERMAADERLKKRLEKVVGNVEEGNDEDKNAETTECGVQVAGAGADGTIDVEEHEETPGTLTVANNPALASTWAVDWEREVRFPEREGCMWKENRSCQLRVN